MFGNEEPENNWDEQMGKTCITFTGYFGGYRNPPVNKFGAWSPTCKVRRTAQQGQNDRRSDTNVAKHPKVWEGGFAKFFATPSAKLLPPTQLDPKFAKQIKINVKHTWTSTCRVLLTYICVGGYYYTRETAWRRICRKHTDITKQLECINP